MYGRNTRIFDGRLFVPWLGLKNFKILRTEEDEPIYTYNDKYTRWFVREAAYGRRVCAFNQYYKSKHYDDIFKIISKEFCVKRIVYDSIEAYMDYKNKHLKVLKKNMKINITIIEMKTLKIKKNIFKKIIQSEIT